MSDETLEIENMRQVKKIKHLLAKPAKAFRDYYEIGECMSQLVGREEVSGMKSWRKVVAETADVSEETLNKCNQFYEKYTTAENVAREQELNELEEIGVGWGLFTTSLRIADASKRHTLLRKAIKKKWTGAELGREIRAQTRSSRGGGRPRRKLKSHGLFPDLEQFGRLSEQFSALHKVWNIRLKKYKAAVVRMSADDKKALRSQIASVQERLQAQIEHGNSVLLEISEMKPVLPESAG